MRTVVDHAGDETSPLRPGHLHIEVALHVEPFFDLRDIHLCRNRAGELPFSLDERKLRLIFMRGIERLEAYLSLVSHIILIFVKGQGPASKLVLFL